MRPTVFIGLEQFHAQFYAMPAVVVEPFLAVMPETVVKSGDER